MTFDYARAFARNRGLVSATEQETLRRSTVAIAGAGGVGGWHAMALARQGVGNFRLADPDTFDVVNFNRQAGAMVSTLGQPKAETMRRMILDINPDARVDAWSCKLDATNTDAFVDGADVVLDGIDFWVLDARRRMFRAARDRKVWAMTAGPVGFGAAFLAFGPDTMRFDDYFGFAEGMSYEDQVVAFLAGLAPRALHAPYLDLRAVDPTSGAAPSSGAACMMCGALMAVESVALLTGKRTPVAAPHFAQWDLLRGKIARGTVRGGGARNFMQRIRRYLLARRLVQLGVFKPAAEARPV